MPESIESYLAILRKSLSKKLPPAELEEFILETEQHLRCSADAEGGGLEGEYAATASFGDLALVARQLKHAHSLNGALPVAGVLACAVIGSIIASMHEYNRMGLRDIVFANFAFFGTPTLVVLGLLALAFVLASSKLRKSVSGKLAVAGVASILLVPLLTCLLFVPLTPNTSDELIPRINSDQRIARLRAQFSALQQAESKMELANRVYGNFESSPLPELRSKNGYRVPIKMVESEDSTGNYDYRILWREYPYFEQAREAYDQHTYAVFDAIVKKNQLARQVEGIRLGEPVLAGYSRYLQVEAGPLAFYFCLFILLNIFAVEVANAYRRVRAKSSPTAIST